MAVLCSLASCEATPVESSGQEYVTYTFATENPHYAAKVCAAWTGIPGEVWPARAF